MKAVILAGGYGKRLRPLTDDRPKPMVEILGKPIIAWQIEWLKMNGVDELALCVGYMKEVIMDYLGDGRRYSVSIEYVVEGEPLGTGGAVKNAERLLKDEERFIVVNGDVLTDLNIGKMLPTTASGKSSIAVVPLPSPYGIVEVGDDSRITGFREKPRLDGFWINAGVYCLSSSVFRYLPEKGSIEYDTFPQLASNGVLYAVKYRDAYWRSIDTHKDVEEASKELSKG
ncbi:MAG: nucleotidyltransferase family protein [Candidatus Nitrosocaldus sp.]|nr:nucleotidyltransferase family protein [Candidatus Nitrosocaldus sp.]MDW8000592.1 nucleotidyltransferase family protein [Candidatus Nitrosocaldus sp.]